MVVTRSSGSGARGGRKAVSGSRPISPGKRSPAKRSPERPGRPGRNGKSAAGDGGADKQRSLVEELAEEIFSRRGYRGTTIREVATQACCSVGQIYKLYPGKLELYAAIIESKAALLSSMVEQTLQSGAPPDERLRRLVFLLLGFFQEHIILFRILARETGPLLVRGTGNFLERVERWRAEILVQTAGTIAEGQRRGVFRPELDPQLAAISFFGLLHGHTDGWILRQEDGMLVDRADAIIDLFLAGVRRGRKR